MSDTAQAWQKAAENYAQGGIPDPICNSEYRCQEAVNILQRARQIRADAALMSEVRDYIKKLRAEGAALLDDLG